MPLALAWQDNAVLVGYLVLMLGLGAWLARKQTSDEEYFLGGRRMPWFAVGLSVIASILSSLTYLSEPGEVWKSGVTHMIGKMLAIPAEMAIVWLVCIPFMMRFRYTSAYEYLQHRFGTSARHLGVALFVALAVMWMGFVVLASSRALAAVSGYSLFSVIATVGLVATAYTMLGGMRAVVWTDVVQVGLLVGGAVAAVIYVAAVTGAGLPEWYDAATKYAATQHSREEVPWFSFDPRVRATVLTVAVNMCIWHVCTHTANQMTVQRYFSTPDMRAARRSFVTGSIVGVFINLLLLVVGLAVMYYYVGQGLALDGGLQDDAKPNYDLVFPTFAVHRLPPGLGGGILAALLAAGMSSIDSGINSLATVLTVDHRAGAKRPKANNVRLAMALTLAFGVFITGAAYGLSFLPKQWGIVDAMPRTFNSITAPLGGMFLVGMFLRRAGGLAVICGTLCGLAVSLGLGYFKMIADQLLATGWITISQLAAWGLWLPEGSALLPDGGVASLSFTWIMPCSLLVTFVAAWIVSLVFPAKAMPAAELTWSGSTRA